MELIKNNPYRITGLLVGTSLREQTKKVVRLKQFIEAEQEPKDDYCFPILGKLNRTVESVNSAASKLNLDSDKMNAALFWFYNGNAITDEPALEALKVAEQQITTDIWTKLTVSGEVTQRNCSAFQNLSTLLLCNAFTDATLINSNLELGISLKLKFLESEFAKEFKALATDETYTTTKKELQLMFLQNVQNEIEKHGGIKSNKFLEIINKQEFSSKEDFLKGFVHKPIEQIEKKIEEAKTKRKANKANCISIGKALYDQTNESLIQLKSILGIANIKFSIISDKVSDEILQCGIDYYLFFRDSNTDPGKETMDLFRKAKTLAIGNIAKQRCQENTESVQEWINNKPERDKQKLIESDLSALIEILKTFEIRNKTIENAKSLINQCRPRLNGIKSVLGSSDVLFLKLSTSVASMAQHYIIEEVNDAQNNIELQLRIDRYGTLNRLKLVVTNAWVATVLIDSLDMEYDFKTSRFNKNKESLRGLCTQLGISTTYFNTTTYTPTTSSGSSSNEGTGIPGWVWIAGIIIIIIILSNLK